MSYFWGCETGLHKSKADIFCRCLYQSFVSYHWPCKLWPFFGYVLFPKECIRWIILKAVLLSVWDFFIFSKSIMENVKVMTVIFWSFALNFFRSQKILLIILLLSYFLNSLNLFNPKLSKKILSSDVDLKSSNNV